jgi:hypothetical protein
MAVTFDMNCIVMSCLKVRIAVQSCEEAFTQSLLIELSRVGGGRINSVFLSSSKCDILR